jgi:nucleotide-binding universal stress UspA family protein
MIMKKILLAFDGSKTSEKALKKTLIISEKFDSSVTVISVIPELYLTELMEVDRERILKTITDETEKVLQKIKMKAKKIKPIKTVIIQGNPAEEIIKKAGSIKSDLIITGSHGRHGARRFLLGSVSSKIVEYAPCAVLVVK